MFCRLWPSFPILSDSPLWNNRTPAFGRRKRWLFHCRWWWCPWLRASWWGCLNTFDIYLCLRWYSTMYCDRFFNWIFLTPSSLCMSCRGFVASFSLGLRLRIRRIVVWLWQLCILLPCRGWGPLLLRKRHWTFRGHWVSSSTLILWSLVLLMLHCLRWDSRRLYRRLDRIFTRCCRWWYSTPPQGWWW